MIIIIMVFAQFISQKDKVHEAWIVWESNDLKVKAPQKVLKRLLKKVGFSLR